MIRTYKKEILQAVCFSIIVIFISWVSSVYRTRPRIVFCNVGQGNGTYVRTHEGKNIIVDAGPPNNAMLVCLGREMPLFEKKIHVAILSHMQSDHVGGFPEIVRRYEVQDVYLPTDKLSGEMKKAMINTQIALTVVHQNEVIQIGDGERIEVLWPPYYPSSTKTSLDMNMFSIVANICLYDECVLLPGDTPFQTLVSSVQLPQQVAVLEISHHGAQNGTSKKLLQLIHPEEAVISVGKNNYGHPSPKVIELLNKFHIPYKRTDLDGDITLYL